MAELHITTLTCVKKQDATGKDEATLQINGVTFSGPHPLGKGDSVTLNARHPFTTSVPVKLVEQDPGTDDELGTVTVSDSLAGLGNQAGVFHALSGADYHMAYHVHA